MLGLEKVRKKSGKKSGNLYIKLRRDRECLLLSSIEVFAEVSEIYCEDKPHFTCLTYFEDNCCRLTTESSKTA